MVKPEVSVVIPTYNMGELLRDAIESVLKQTFKDFEIIVVDDGSSDDTKVIIQAFQSQVKYLYQTNRGESSARNLGIREAKGRYIAFLDADDVWLPRKLEIQTAMMKNDPYIGLVACGAVHKNEHGKVILNHVPKNYGDQQRLLKALFIGQIIPGSSSGVLIRKECFDAVGNFDERIKIGPDWDMWLRIAKEFRVCFAEEPLVVIRWTSSKPEYRTIDNEKYFVNMVIEKNIRGKYKRKAYANLYSRIGSYHLASSRRKEAFWNLTNSIWKYPLPLFPRDYRERHSPSHDYRYYLLLRCLFPEKVIWKMKSLLKVGKREC